MEQNILLNASYCYSIKSKFKATLQCSNKPKIGSNLCGKHINCKNIIYYGNGNNNAELLNNNLVIETFLDDPPVGINNVTDIINNIHGTEIYEGINNIVNNSVNINTICFSDSSKSDQILSEFDGYINPTIDNVQISNESAYGQSSNGSGEDKKIYEKDELYDRIINNINTCIYSIRKSLKHCKLNNIVNTKNSKQVLIKELKKFIIKERYYNANKESLILVQSIIRKWIIYRRKKCYNDTDILTFTSKYDIESKYFYVFSDTITNKQFAYDIRTLFEIINSNYSSCPYTMRKFTDDEKNKITEYCTLLTEKNIIVKIEKPVLSEKEEIEMKMKDLFHKINMLDNYTDYTWFKNLGLSQLINLYIYSEDIWNYRSNMTADAKKRIVHGGVVFNIPLQIIKNQKSVTKMRTILLTDFMKCITEGVDINEKKLGAILILTALVEVSMPAAVAMPHLIQI